MDPRQRVTIGEVLERLAAIGETRGFHLKSGLKISQVAPSRPPVPSAAPAQPSPQLPRRPPPPSSSNTSSPAATPRHMASSLPRTPPAHRPAPPNANQYAPPSQSVQPGLFSSLKGGAGSLFKNIKVGLKDKSINKSITCVSINKSV